MLLTEALVEALPVRYRPALGPLPEPIVEAQHHLLLVAETQRADDCGLVHPTGSGGGRFLSLVVALPRGVRILLYGLVAVVLLLSACSVVGDDVERIAQRALLQRRAVCNRPPPQRR